MWSLKLFRKTLFASYNEHCIKIVGLKSCNLPRKMSSNVPAIDCSNLDETQVKLLKEACILVDENDKVIGPETKKNCHLKTNIKEKRMLHRAFSVFLFTADGSKMLLQQRASSKITYPNLWSNACCSHPLFEIEKEQNGWLGVKLAAIRRLNYELGISFDAFTTDDFVGKGRIHYEAENSVKTYPDEFMEHEIDYLLFIQKNVRLDNVNENEVKALKWVGQDELKKWNDEKSEDFTPWFNLIVKKKLFSIWEAMNNNGLKEDQNELNGEVIRWIEK